MSQPSIAAAILCAGFGTRLRPLTEHLPKPALPFLGTPLAMHWVNKLRRCGIEDIGANVHHLPDAMEHCLRSSAPSVRWAIHREQGPILGTGGGTRELWRQLGPEKTLLVCHGDVIVAAQLAELLAVHRASGAAATLLLMLRTPEQALRGVFTDASGRVVRILSASSQHPVLPVFEHAFTGVQVLEPEVYHSIPPDGPACLVTQVYPSLLARHRPIAAMLSSAYFADLGTPSRYLGAQREILSAPALRDALLTESPRPSQEGIRVEAGAQVEAGVQLLAPVIIGPGVKLRRGSRIGPHVVLSGQLEVEATLRNVSAWGAGRLQGEWQDRMLMVTGSQLVEAHE